MYIQTGKEQESSWLILRCCCCCCFGGGTYQHCSYEGLLYSHPNGAPLFISRGAAHTKRRERPLLAKDVTKAKEFS
jgi:hypothetical protein